jgi:hypothetical protein
MSKKPPSRSAPNPAWIAKSYCGNPTGRPKGSRAKRTSDFDVLVEMTVTVAHRGGTREITAKEALQRRIYRDGLAGKGRAQRQVVKWIIKREAWLAKHAPAVSRPAVKRFISPDPDNADAALQLLGIAAANPARADYGADRAQLLLEPWAVHAALRRRRGGKRLTEDDRFWIRRCTRDSDCLRWPRGTGK